MSDLRNGISAAKVVFATSLDYSSITVVEMETAEPSLDFVISTVASSPTNDHAVSFRMYNYGEVNLARLSESGACYYIRTIDRQGATALDVPGVYAGSGRPGTALLPSCSGNVIGGYATTATRFPGW